MIINQTTTLIFEYPQDYLQEQEWCKTKEDRWIHKGTDTLGAVYENQISYSIGATADRKTEPTISKMEQVETMSCQECKHFHENAVMYLDQCDFCFKDCKYEPKDEPQICEECEHWSDTEDGCADRHGCTITERSE